MVSMSHKKSVVNREYFVSLLFKIVLHGIGIVTERFERKMIIRIKKWFEVRKAYVILLVKSRKK